MECCRCSPRSCLLLSTACDQHALPSTPHVHKSLRVSRWCKARQTPVSVGSGNRTAAMGSETTTRHEKQQNTKHPMTKKSSRRSRGNKQKQKTNKGPFRLLKHPSHEITKHRRDRQASNTTRLPATTLYLSLS
ncbi:unnamed protein product, partial [Ectocarpus fasciculatus]